MAARDTYTDASRDGSGQMQKKEVARDIPFVVGGPDTLAETHDQGVEHSQPTG